ALAAGKQTFFYSGHGGIDLFGADGSLSQGRRAAAAQCRWIVLDACAISFYHGGRRQLDALVGGQTPVAGRTATTSADGGALFGNPRVDNLGVETATERTFHGSLCPGTARALGC